MIEYKQELLCNETGSYTLLTIHHLLEDEWVVGRMDDGINISFFQICIQTLE